MTKRLSALPSALVLIFSVLPLTAFARTAEGYYNGYYYSATLTTTEKTATTKMTYMGTSKIKSNGTAYYITTSGVSGNINLLAMPKQSSTSGSSTAPTNASFTWSRQYYYVDATQVNYIEATVS